VVSSRLPVPRGGSRRRKANLGGASARRAVHHDARPHCRVGRRRFRVSSKVLCRSGQRDGHRFAVLCLNVQVVGMSPPGADSMIGHVNQKPCSDKRDNHNQNDPNASDALHGNDESPQTRKTASNTEQPASGKLNDLRKLESEDVGTWTERGRQIRRCELPSFQPLLRGHEERPERPNHGNRRMVDRDSGASPVARRKKDHVPCATLVFVGRRSSRRTFLLSRRMAGARRRNGSRGGHRIRRAAQLTETHDGRKSGHQNRQEKGLSSSTHRARMI
jgi:hypothetical protein